MGCSYDVRVIVGCEVDKNLLFKKARVRTGTCSHDVDKEYDFCPKCGVKIWGEEREEIDGYDPYRDQISISKNGDEKIYVITGEDCESAFVGYLIGKVDSSGDIPCESSFFKNTSLIQDHFRQRVEDCLKWRGMWDEKKFGIHTVFRISC